MKIILTENVDKLGNSGEIVEVKDGFARNYLLPRGLAEMATKSAVKAYNEQQKLAEKKEAATLVNAQKLADKLSKTSITATVTVGEDDKIFGSITNQNIADLLAEKGFEVDRHNITIPEAIKALGTYTVQVKLYKTVKADVKLWVIK